MKKDFVAISWDDDFLNIVAAQNVSAGWKVDHSILEKTPDQEEELVSKLKDLLRKKVLKGRKILLVVPRTAVTIKYLELPAASPEELKSMVDFQSGRQIPFSPEEIVYDYKVMNMNENGYARVLLAIVKRDVVIKYLDILHKAGVKPVSIELSSLALVAFFKYANNTIKESDKKISADVPVALVDVNNSMTDIVVVRDGMPVFTRAISIGNQQIQNSSGEWIEEINRSLMVFQREQKCKISKIVIINDDGDKCKQLINQRTGISGISWNISDFLSGVKGIADDSSFTNGQVSSAGLLGVISEGAETAVNLIPETVRLTWLGKEKRSSLLITAILLIALLAVAGLTINKQIADRNKYFDHLKSRLKKTDPLAKELAVKKERLLLIRNQLSVERTSLDVLRELYTVIPQKTTINVFIYDDKLGVTLKGTSPAMSEVFALVPKLENSKYFGNVTSRYATQRKIKGRELVDFHIDCIIEEPGIVSKEETT